MGQHKAQFTDDVVVIGSGATGLTAAIVAHDRGARVRILEATDRVGGTSAVSGGGLWVPMNRHMGEAGFSDNREDALAYCRALAMDRADDASLQAFVDTAAEMIDYLEEHTPLKFAAVSAPDYQPDVVGGRLGGRTLDPRPFDTNQLGPWRDRLRSPSSLAFPITLKEVYEDFKAYYQPWKIPQEILVERMMSGVVCLGQALVASLLKGVLDRGIAIELRTRARRLVRTSDAVQGLEAERGDEILRFDARAVILASGGFEWNEALKSRFVPGQITHPNSPPCALGDGLVMAMELGADLANMSEVWQYPSVAVPGETYEGRPLARGIKAERSGPHVIWVNRRGDRFVNEAANYNSVGKALMAMDANAPRYQNSPAWAVLDSQYREKYVLGTSMPDDADPPWVAKADTLESLAEKIGVAPGRLRETVERWNTFCTAKDDLDFDRGKSRFDRYQGDPLAPHPNLGSIEKAPFYAFEVRAGALGTKGGPRTNERAEVQDVRQRSIPGLYAVGNVAASITGPGYYGAGSTLGPGMTWAYIAGQQAASLVRAS